MKSNESSLLRIIFLVTVSPVGLYCFSVMAAGSCRLVVLSITQASVQETSSSLSVKVVLLGGSVVLQDAEIKSKSMSESKNLSKLIFFILLSSHRIVFFYIFWLS